MPKMATLSHARLVERLYIISSTDTITECYVYKYAFLTVFTIDPLAQSFKLVVSALLRKHNDVKLEIKYILHP